MPRAARIVLPDYPHHITQRGNNREQVFFDVGDYLKYLELLARYARKYQLEILAWCLMPNHVHLLAVPRTEESLAKAMGSVSLVYTQQQNNKLQRSGRIWQNRFFSCVVGNDDYLLATARYIELNAVRAGKAKRPEDWPWSSARAHLLGKPDPLLQGPFPGFPGHQSWRELLKESPEQDLLLRQATRTGRPFADTALLQELAQVVGRQLIPRRRGRPRKTET